MHIHALTFIHSSAYKEARWNPESDVLYTSCIFFPATLDTSDQMQSTAGK